MFPFVRNFLDLLRLLFLLGFFFIVNFLDLGLVVITLLFVIVVIVISNFLLGSLFSVELDGEANEFGMLLNQILKTTLFQIFGHILLHMKDDTSTTSNTGIGRLGNSERSAGLGSRSVDIGISVVLGYNFDLIGDQIGGI